MRAYIKEVLTDIALCLGLLSGVGLVIVVAWILGAICSLIFGGETWWWGAAFTAIDIVLFAVLARQFMKEIAEELKEDGDRRTPMQ